MCRTIDYWICHFNRIREYSPLRTMKHCMIQTHTHDVIHDPIDKTQFMVRLICLLRALIECNAFCALIWIGFDSVFAAFFGKKILNQRIHEALNACRLNRIISDFCFLRNKIEFSRKFRHILITSNAVVLDNLSTTAITFLKIKRFIRKVTIKIKDFPEDSLNQKKNWKYDQN